MHEEAGKGLAVTEREDGPQDRNDEGQWESGPKHEQMKAQNVHDDWTEDGQRERDVKVHQQKDAAEQLHAKYNNEIMRLKEGDRELARQSRRHFCGNEMQEAIQPEDAEDNAQQETSNERNDFHRSPPPERE